MASQGKDKKNGGTYCAAGAQNCVSCKNNTHTSGVSMHHFPWDAVLRQKWTRFVRRHQKDFTPSKWSALCSVHFEDSGYEQIHLALVGESSNTLQLKRNLIKGSVPTRDMVLPSSSPLTS